MQKLSEFTTWLKNEYIYSSDAITGMAEVYEKAYSLRDCYESIKCEEKIINSSEWKTWMEEREAEYKILSEKNNTPRINSKSFLKLLQNHPKGKKYKIYQPDSLKVACILNEEKDFLYSINCENLFSERYVKMKYSFNAEGGANSGYMLNNSDRKTDKNEKYKSFFDIFSTSDVDQIFNAVELFEEEYVGPSTEAYLKFIKDDYIVEKHSDWEKKSFKRRFYNNKHMLQKAEKWLTETYKDNPDKILEDCLEPMLRKIYLNLKNK